MVELDNSASSPGKILITGGTSGLGLEIVRFFLQKGYKVAATGRNDVPVTEHHENYTFVKADFSDLYQTAGALKRTCETSRFDIVINNAGILSPPDFTRTVDGFEYTFQVNFLSHLLVNEIILKNTRPGRTVLIVATVSPVYRLAEKDLKIQTSGEHYNPLMAYSNSKYYLALMCSLLPVKYPDLNLTCIGFNPGVFSSNIFRMQRHWFRILYRAAAPFMSNPGKIAGRLFKITGKKDLISGAIYKPGKRPSVMLQKDSKTADIFWQECYKIVEPCLK